MSEEKQFEFVRTESYESLYSNSVQFETSVWDLKLIFGQLDQAVSKIEQHTAITLTWHQAKITAYYLLANIVWQQALEGEITVPARVTPSRPDPYAPEVAAANRPTVTYLRWVHEQIFGPNPYVPPEVEAAVHLSKPAHGAESDTNEN